jgi:hypothetical protein
LFGPITLHILTSPISSDDLHVLYAPARCIQEVELATDFLHADAVTFNGSSVLQRTVSTRRCYSARIQPDQTRQLAKLEWICMLYPAKEEAGKLSSVFPLTAGLYLTDSFLSCATVV